MIKKYEIFKENMILEKIINESNIYYSPNFRNFLLKNKYNDDDEITKEISKELLKIEGDDIKSDITFIDIADTIGYVSFTKMKNAMGKITNYYKDDTDRYVVELDKDEDKDKRIMFADFIYKKDIGDVYSKSRSMIKIGRFINKLLPNKYNNQYIVKFTKKLKSYLNDDIIFKIVSGDDILKYYKTKNYKSNDGELGKSCMNDSEDEQFKIYTDNPESCRMLVMLDNDKLIGRALIWKVDILSSSSKLPNEIYLLDRIYTEKDHYDVLFEEYAKKNGWGHKLPGKESPIYIIYNGNKIEVGMSVDLKKNADYFCFPYMDTFQIFSSEKNELYNRTIDYIDMKDNYLLTDTSGDYYYLEDFVWSDFYNYWINLDNSVWSESENSHLYIYDSVYIEGDYEGYYHIDDDDIVVDLTTGENVHKNECDYIENIDEYSLKENNLKIIKSYNMNGDIKDYDYFIYNDYDSCELMDSASHWFKYLSKCNKDWLNYDGILKELTMMDSENNLILEEYSIFAYEVTGKSNKSEILDSENLELSSNIFDDNYHVTYLKEVDAFVLGYDINKKEKIIMDEFDYYIEIIGIDNLKNILQIYKNVLKLLKDDNKMKNKDYSFDFEIFDLKYAKNIVEKNIKLLESKPFKKIH